MSTKDDNSYHNSSYICLSVTPNNHWTVFANFEEWDTFTKDDNENPQLWEYLLNDWELLLYYTEGSKPSKVTTNNEASN